MAKFFRSLPKRKVSAVWYLQLIIELEYDLGKVIGAKAECNLHI